MTLASRGRDAHVRRVKEAAGVSVTYTRLGGGTLTLTAVHGLTTFSSEEALGRVEISARDYLVAVADLAVSGTAFAPAVGDRITETINGVAKTFEVQDPQNGGETACRYSDQDRAMWRLHMKAV